MLIAQRIVIKDLLSKSIESMYTLSMYTDLHYNNDSSEYSSQRCDEIMQSHFVISKNCIF